MNINPYRFTGQGLLHLHDYSTGIGGLGIRKEEALPLLEANQRQMSLLQDRLYAENKESVLIIFQAMDAAGKDSAIKHVISGMNPQGVTVHNFKQPCTEELTMIISGGHSAIFRPGAVSVFLTAPIMKMCWL
jgi:polyphosphate kinase 2 (PPK2 family)